jgi:hypothetical protein
MLAVFWKSEQRTSGGRVQTNLHNQRSCFLQIAGVSRTSAVYYMSTLGHSIRRLWRCFLGHDEGVNCRIAVSYCARGCLCSEAGCDEVDAKTYRQNLGV